jgi:arsenate reductase
MRPLKVLFVCVHNSFRSQLAQAIARKRFNPESQVLSAGLDSSRSINSLAIQVGLEHGYDLSTHSVTDVFELYKEGHTFDYVVAVCSKEAYERCPIFPGVHQRLHWPLDDPSAMQVSEEERVYLTHKLIEQLETKIDDFLVSIQEQA